MHTNNKMIIYAFDILYIIRILCRTLSLLIYHYSDMKLSFLVSASIVEIIECGYLAGKGPLDSLEGLECVGQIYTYIIVALKF